MFTVARAPTLRAHPHPLRRRRSVRSIRSSASPETETKTQTVFTRRNIVNAVTFALAIPLARDIIHDLGFFSGEDDEFAELPEVGEGQAVAVFAGGCFWCMEKPFDVIPGVLATTSGYIGGTKERPKYKEVGGGRAGGAVESVRVLYDASKTTYEKLLDVYWRQIDATRDDGQFVDGGAQYRPVIWAVNEAQRAAAEASKEALEKRGVFGKAIKVQVVDASELTFWPAERYHQDYYKKNANRYGFYRMVSGRDEYIASVWGTEKSS